MDVQREKKTLRCVIGGSLFGFSVNDCSAWTLRFFLYPLDAAAVVAVVTCCHCCVFVLIFCFSVRIWRSLVSIEYMYAYGNLDSNIIFKFIFEMGATRGCHRHQSRQLLRISRICTMRATGPEHVCVLARAFANALELFFFFISFV